MFSPETLQFLTDLKANNDRDWFAANRAHYEAHVLAPSRAFIAELSDRLSAALGRPVEGRLYRLNRDLRFSKDKTPYNVHVHIGFAEGGPAIWMVGFEPGRLSLGYGAFAFPPAVLTRWRIAVADPSGAGLAEVLEGLADQGLRLSEPELKRVPAPYPADHPRATLLRHKSLSVWEDQLPMESVYGPPAAERIAKALTVFAPLRDWMTTRL
ncbi:DUF2461 domain-containing protein [Cereibacter sphaeroides]|nr:DUF2461 domain-containing protein [Cereibacter sphaeroides]